MRYLGLLRHAKSEWGESDKRDFDRGVNSRGRRGARLIGRHIRNHATGFDRILASPAERVKVTLAEAGIDADVAWERRLYLATAETMMDLLREIEGEPAAVLLVGHNPGLGDLVLELVAPAQENALFDEAKVKFPTAAFALIELPIDRWRDLASETGRLVDFTRPRDLDPALGPEL